MDRRTLIAVVLCIVVIIVWQKFMVPKRPQQQPIAPQRAAAVSEESSMVEEVKPQDMAPIEERLYTVDTQKYTITFSNIGGAIKRIELKDQQGDDGSNYTLVDIGDPREYIYATADTASRKPLAPGAYKSSRKSSGIIFTAQTEAGLEIEKEYTVDNSLRTIELRLKVVNNTSAPQSLNYIINLASGINQGSRAGRRFLETTYKAPDKVRRKGIAGLKGTLDLGNADWVAIKNKYFSLVAKPHRRNSGFAIDRSAHGNLVLTMQTGGFTVDGGATEAQDYTLYAGLTDYGQLKESGFGFEGAVTFGFFSGISQVLITVLKFFYRYTHNWGVAIILLTVAITAALYPLTRRSLTSMKRMQELQPKIEALKSQYKENPQKLNKEIMELYRNNKVNPFGGCLPMLLQMPIYIALYQGLMRAVELRGANFLWIKDLTKPDALMKIGTFDINILPLLAAGMMFFQQKFASPHKATEQQQKMMAYFFPLFFGFIFYNFASGFVIYFLTSMTMTTLYQWRIMRKKN